MADNGRMTRSLRRHQSAYEDQAHAIQERIDTCREAYHDAQEFLQDERLDANDSAQRKTQLIAQYRANIMQINLHAAKLDAANQAWYQLMQTHNIAHEDSEWATEMRRQHDRHSERAPNLDYEIRELIAIYRDNIERSQRPADTDSMGPSPELGRGLQPTMLEPLRQAQTPPAPVRPASSEDNESTSTKASNDGSGRSSGGISDNPRNLAGEDASNNPRNLAGEDEPRETPQRQTHPDARTTAPPAAPQPRRRVRIQEPAETVTLEDLSLEDEENEEQLYDAPSPLPVRRTRTRPAAERPFTSTPRHTTRQRRTEASRSSSYGLFAYGDGLYTNAKPMAWRNAHIGNGQHHETFFYGTPPAADRDDGYRRSPLYLASLSAANAAPPDRVTDLVTGTAGADIRSRRWSPVRESPPFRAADLASRTVHRERLQHDLRTAVPPAGRGRFDGSDFGHFDAPAFASAPTAAVGQTPAAWNTQPPARAAAVPHRPPSPEHDFGADFGSENASKFYQNAIATYQPNTSSKAPPLVLKELPIQKFSGEIRAYPVFRNRFIDTVGGRSDLEPRHKFQYLLQCLEGEPLRLATGYLITDKNYFELLDRLEDRYGDNSTLVNLLAQDLINMKPVGQTARDLRRFHDEALRLADEMEQAGKDIDDNVLWRQTLISKMPQSLRNKIYENMRKDPLSAPVHEILACVSNYLRVLERGEIALSWNATADGNSGRGGRPCHPDPRNTPYRAGTHATDADVTYAANAKRVRKRTCAFCGRDHWASQCNIYVSIAQRLRRIRELNYCLLCLRAGHWVGMCPKKMDDACKHCHGSPHHRAICTGQPRKERQPFSSLRHSPVRAPTPGMPGVPTNEHG